MSIFEDYGAFNAEILKYTHICNVYDLKHQTKMLHIKFYYSNFFSDKIRSDISVNCLLGRQLT